MIEPEYPTPWMRRVLWQALTALAIAIIFAVAIGFLYLVTRVLAFLQPILVPFAIAGVLAYLLEPVVAWLVRHGTTRLRALMAVFTVTTLICAGFLIWLIPNITYQTSNLGKKVPDITYRVRLGIRNVAVKIRDSYGIHVLPNEFLVVPPPKGEAKPPPPPIEPDPAASHAVAPPVPNPETPGIPATGTAPAVAVATPTTPAAPPVASTENPEEILQKIGSGDWVNDALPSVGRNFWNFLRGSLGGFLGFFGFLLSLVIVPLYLFYLLAESPNISAGWSKYVPLRASAFKDEVVDCLTEINGYLIAFFRGQLVVSMINGVATGTLLAILGLDFGVLIGCALCIFGIIPYIGIVVCWIPAVIIASVQGESWVVQNGAAWWVFPLVVTAAFAVVQQVDALFITPKIVGERVGLHPVTVIFSVFLWSLLLGGLLGAILAVPLTATLKVLLKRYVWERSLRDQTPLATVGGP